jgi:3-phenylpropionate/cinnamic acid dioxygenase small subunit
MTVVAGVELAAAAELLFRAGELLDDGRLAEWLDLYAEDALYHVPQGDDPNPASQVQIAYDDKRRLAERVMRLASGFAYSQDPPSRTVHLIANVRLAGEVEGDVEVRSSLAVAEVRRGQQQVYYARVVHRLTAGADGQLLIRCKEIRLVNRDVPLGNVTFLI